MPKISLGDLAKRAPFIPIRVTFRNDGANQEGSLLGDAGFVASPCASMRYFPASGKTFADYGWSVPYWYAEEVVAIEPATPAQVAAAVAAGCYFYADENPESPENRATRTA